MSIDFVRVGQRLAAEKLTGEPQTEDASAKFSCFAHRMRWDARQPRRRCRWTSAFELSRPEFADQIDLGWQSTRPVALQLFAQTSRTPTGRRPTTRWWKLKSAADASCASLTCCRSQPLLARSRCGRANRVLAPIWKPGSDRAPPLYGSANARRSAPAYADTPSGFASHRSSAHPRNDGVAWQGRLDPRTRPEQRNLWLRSGTTAPGLPFTPMERASRHSAGCASSNGAPICLANTS